MERIQCLRDPQMELLLIRSCFGVPKLNYWLRTCDPGVIAASISDFDLSVDTALQHILGVPLIGLDRDIASLPLSLGGLGIPRAASIAPLAFVSSIGSTWQLVPFSSPRAGYSIAASVIRSQGVLVPDLPAKAIPSASPQIPLFSEFRQSGFSLQAGLALKSDIMCRISKPRQVLLTGRAAKGANYWLTSAPNEFLKTVLDPPTFRMLLKFHLGMPLSSAPGQCPDCFATQDVFGYHALSCKKASGFIDQHNSIVNGIVAVLRSANVSCSLEARNPMIDNQQRPGDIYIPDFDVYGEAYLDVSVINILAPSHIERANVGPLAGSKIRFDAKKQKYPDLGPRFKPLVLECTGGWHPYSMDYLKTMADRIASCSLKTPTQALNSILTGASFRLQRYQGIKLMRRCLGR